LEPGPGAGGTTEGQALLQHPDGGLQVPLGEVQEAEATVGHDRCGPSTFQHGEAERLLPVAPTLDEGPERAQGQHQTRSGPDLQLCPGCARLLIGRLHVLPRQLGRSAEVADGPVGPPEGIGCTHLQGALAELGCEREGLLARRNGAVMVSRLHAFTGHVGQYLSQADPIVERPSQGLGLTQEGETSPILSPCVQRACQSDAEVDGLLPGLAVLG
jgi:hypothetical protein